MVLDAQSGPEGSRAWSISASYHAPVGSDDSVDDTTDSSSDSDMTVALQVFLIFSLIENRYWK
jgi:hypothetical protein